MTAASISELWEDAYFIHWEGVEDKYREPIEDAMARFDEAGGIEEAIDWLNENDIDPDALPFQCKFVNVTVSRDYALPEIAEPCGRTVYEFDKPIPHGLAAGEIGERNCLIFPIIDDGKTIDIGMLGEDFGTVRQKAIWLGGDNIEGESVRLHSGVYEWLEAGATGCVYIDEQRRTPMKRLQAVHRVQCNNVALALEAWEWAYGAKDSELARFEIDDDSENIKAYFAAQAASAVLTEKHGTRFNMVFA